MRPVSTPVKAELLALQKRDKNGILRPAVIVEWASDHPKSALYRQFEWDDTKAAKEYRLWQARELVRITVVTEGGDPMLVNLSIDRQRGGGYRSIDDVVNDKSLSAIMLQDAINDLERVRARYRFVKELTSVWAEVDKVAKASSKKKAA